MLRIHMLINQLLINKRVVVGLKHYNDSEAFIECQYDVDDVYKNIKEYNRNKERKILVVFDMIDDMLSNRKYNPMVT